MLQAVLAEMEKHVFSQAILVNLHQGMDERAIKSEHLRSFFKSVIIQHEQMPPQDADEHRVQILTAAWHSGSGENLQVQGPDCTSSRGSLVTFKSLGGLVPIVSQMDNDPGTYGFKTKIKKSWDVISDEECLEIAQEINSFAEDRNDLHLGMKIAGHRCPAWFTRSEDCPVPGAPNGPTDLRNWLGLAHIEAGRPLFAFHAKRPFEELRHEMTPRLARPTVFDGIDMAWFKQRRFGHYDKDDYWGRASDLTRAGDNPSVVGDGGPESVAYSLPIPGNFLCSYVGRVNGSTAAPDDTFVDLLRNPVSLRSITDQVRIHFGTSE
jgi:hypothetical protein